MEDTLNRPAAQYGGAKLIIGIFFVIHGLLLTADNLGALSAWRYLRYWPAVLVLVGLYKIWEPGAQLAGLIFLIVGGSLLAYNAHWVRVSIFDLWPLLLIGAGVAIVARATGIGLGETKGNTIIAVLSSQKLAPREFAGARIVAVMGGCELDLTDADLKQNPTVIEVFTMWGGIEISVPETWEVVGEVVPFMGGFQISVAPRGTPQRQLIVRGSAVMAGIEVKRRKS